MGPTQVDFCGGSSLTWLRKEFKTVMREQNSIDFFHAIAILIHSSSVISRVFVFFLLVPFDSAKWQVLALKESNARFGA
jgi:hypothetical protein